MTRRNDDEVYEEKLRAWKDTCARLARDERGDAAQWEDPGSEAGPSQQPQQQHMDAGYVPFTQAEQSQLDGTHRKPLYYEGPRLQPEAVEQLRTAARQGLAGRDGPHDIPVVPDSDGPSHGPHGEHSLPDAAPSAGAAQPDDPAGSQPAEPPEQTRRSARLASASQKAAEGEQAEQPRSNRGSGRWSFPNVFTNALNSITSSFRSTPPAAAAGPQQDEVVSQLTSETEGTSSDAVPSASPTRRQPHRAAKAAASQRLAAVASDRPDTRSQAHTPERSQAWPAASLGRAGGGRGRLLAPRRRAAPVGPEAVAGDSSDEGAHQPAAVMCRHRNEPTGIR